jgi:hypothetical protein
MAKSAQAKFNEYMDECRETSYAINQLIDRSKEATDGYAYAAGFLNTMLADAIAELPKARRADFRNRLFRRAQKFIEETVDKQTV